MTSSIKNPYDPDSQGKSSQSTRSNPVCLELGVTLRSLPTEAGNPAQPIREDLKTVIVFDNGAVLRSTNNLKAGLTLILSNANSRDVVCRVVTGRSMPAVKGYVEVEFIEPVKDFWGIHQEAITASPAAPPLAPATPRAFSTPPVATPSPAPPASQIQRPVSPTPPAAPPGARISLEPPGASPSSLASTLEFDEIPPPMGISVPGSTRESKPASKPVSRPEPVPLPRAIPPTLVSSVKEASEKPAAEYDHFQVASPTSVGGWTAPAPEPEPVVVNQAAVSPTYDASPPPASTPAGHDFMSKGLMAYEQPSEATGTSGGRAPMILGMAALVLAAVCAGVFFMRRGGSPAPVAKAAQASEPAPSEPAATSAPPAPIQVSREPATSLPAQTESQPQAQTIASHPVQPGAAVAAIPAAEIANTSPSDSRSNSGSARQQDKSTPAGKQQGGAAASKRPMIADLKMGAPSAPRNNLADGGDSGAPMTEVASNEMPSGATPANLLTSSGRTANPPEPPALAPAPAPALPPAPLKILTDPKLISSVRPVYPQTARQSNIEGSVTLVIYIDQTGKVFSARALTGPVMLRAAAEDAVKQWKYSPALEDGKPAQTHVVVKVDFKIQ